MLLAYLLRETGLGSALTKTRSPQRSRSDPLLPQKRGQHEPSPIPSPCWAARASHQRGWVSVLPHPVLLSNPRSQNKSHGMLCGFITQGYEKSPGALSEKQLTRLRASQQTSAKPCTTTPGTPPKRTKTRIQIRHAPLWTHSH